jgi:hypothetical protein
LYIANISQSYNTTGIMRFSLFIFLVFWFSTPVHSQLFGSKADSIAHAGLKSMKYRDRNKFKPLLQNRKNIDLFRLADSLAYETIFIEESYCRETKKLVCREMYFRTNDSLPWLIFVNGKKSYIAYDSYCVNQLEPSDLSQYKIDYTDLLARYTKFKPVQKIFYPYAQVCCRPHVWMEKLTKKFKQRTRKELRTTVKIMTMVDRKKNSIHVSLQTPDPDPDFKTVLAYSGF